MSGTVVVCLGNAFRRDDGVGPAVAAQLRGALAPAVALVELDGDPARLVEAWSGADLAIVVDAARSGEPPGTVRRIDAAADATGAGEGPGGGLGGEIAGGGRPTSSHGGSLGDAVRLGAALGRAPGRLVVYAVEGRDFGDGPGLSAAVALAVPEVAARVAEDAEAAGQAGAAGETGEAEDPAVEETGNAPPSAAPAPGSGAS